MSKADQTETAPSGVGQPTDAAQAKPPRRPYAPPRVLSAEPLEAAAATCDPPAGAFGKSVPFPCGTLGS